MGIEHKETKQIEPEFWFYINKPPLIERLIKSNQSNPGINITRKTFDKLIESSQKNEESTALVDATRRIEVTGIIPNFVSSGMTSDKVLEILTGIEKDQMIFIKTFPKVVQRELLYSYINDEDLTPRALVAQNEVWLNILKVAKEYRANSPIALFLREKTANEMRQTLDFLKNTRPFIDEQVINNKGSADDSPLYNVHPIQYLFPADGTLSGLKQAIVEPNLKLIEIYDPDFMKAKEVRYKTVYEIIREITPPILLRENEDTSGEPESPLWLIKKAGMASQSIIQELTNWLKTKYKIKDLINHPTLAIEGTQEFFYNLQQIKNQD